MLKYLNGNRKEKLVLLADNPHFIKWYLDASFAVHPYFKIHAGGLVTLGGGSIQYISCKKNLNTRSSTEAELIGADDTYTMVLWKWLLMVSQGYNIVNNILY